jgi:predicted ester cyclase
MLIQSTLTASILASMSLATPALAGAVPSIKEIIHPAKTSVEKQKSGIKAATAFAGFWNSGDATLLDDALSPDFIDRTLPPGRPQGRKGPIFASTNFRKAVPDLSVTVEKIVVAGDYVTVHMVFDGHFTGIFGSTTGKGQAIHFIATDLYHIKDGLIAENWHIEDNLTLLTQMGVASVKD